MTTITWHLISTFNAICNVWYNCIISSIMSILSNKMVYKCIFSITYMIICLYLIVLHNHIAVEQSIIIHLTTMCNCSLSIRVLCYHLFQKGSNTIKVHITLNSLPSLSYFDFRARNRHHVHFCCTSLEVWLPRWPLYDRCNSSALSTCSTDQAAPLDGLDYFQLFSRLLLDHIHYYSHLDKTCEHQHDYQCNETILLFYL